MGKEEGNTTQISGLFKINIMTNYFRHGTSDWQRWENYQWQLVDSYSFGMLVIYVQERRIAMGTSAEKDFKTAQGTKTNSTEAQIHAAQLQVLHKDI